jgi:hypothetical protein
MAEAGNEYFFQDEAKVRFFCAQAADMVGHNTPYCVFR